MSKIKIISVLYLGMLTLISSAQTWEREYGNTNRREKIFASCGSYDKGFVLGLRVDDSRIWIIKTNINGEILWSKYIISTENIYLTSIDCSSSGEIIITGAYLELDENGDPFLLKLDSCGNQAWCKVANLPDGNYGRRVLYSNDGYIIWHTYGDEDLYTYNHLWKFNNDGFAIWKKNIASRYEHPLIHSPLFNGVHKTEDNGIILTGSCYYPSDTNNPTGTYKLRPFTVKTDSTGNEKWLLAAGYSENIAGHLDDIVEVDDYYVAVGWRYDTSSTFTSPLFLRISDDGELLFHTVLNQGDTLENYLVGISKTPDSNLIIAGRTRRNEIDSLKMGIFKTDTSGAILKWIENNNGSPINQCMVKTTDHKYLITGYAVHNSNYNGYAVKVNQNLEFDSIYTYPFVYDSLCPEPIVSDTIECECDILVMEEELEVDNQTKMIEIYPNPANEQLVVGGCWLVEHQWIIEVFDLFGRKVIEIAVSRGREEAIVDVTGWQKGLYLVKVSCGDGTMGSGKVVVE